MSSAQRQRRRLLPKPSTEGSSVSLFDFHSPPEKQKPRKPRSAAKSRRSRMISQSTRLAPPLFRGAAKEANIAKAASKVGQQQRQELPLAEASQSPTPATPKVKTEAPTTPGTGRRKKRRVSLSSRSAPLLNCALDTTGDTDDHELECSIEEPTGGLTDGPTGGLNNRLTGAVEQETTVQQTKAQATGETKDEEESEAPASARKDQSSRSFAHRLRSTAKSPAPKAKRRRVSNTSTTTTTVSTSMMPPLFARPSVSSFRSANVPLTGRPKAVRAGAKRSRAGPPTSSVPRRPPRIVSSTSGRRGRMALDLLGSMPKLPVLPAAPVRVASAASSACLGPSVPSVEREDSVQHAMENLRRRSDSAIARVVHAALASQQFVRLLDCDEELRQRWRLQLAHFFAAVADAELCLQSQRQRQHVSLSTALSVSQSHSVTTRRRLSPALRRINRDYKVSMQSTTPTTTNNNNKKKSVSFCTYDLSSVEPPVYGLLDSTRHTTEFARRLSKAMERGYFFTALSRASESAPSLRAVRALHECLLRPEKRQEGPEKRQEGLEKRREKRVADERCARVVAEQLERALSQAALPFGEVCANAFSSLLRFAFKSVFNVQDFLGDPLVKAMRVRLPKWFPILGPFDPHKTMGGPPASGDDDDDYDPTMDDDEDQGAMPYHAAEIFLHVHSFHHARAAFDELRREGRDVPEELLAELRDSIAFFQDFRQAVKGHAIMLGTGVDAEPIPSQWKASNFARYLRLRWRELLSLLKQVPAVLSEHFSSWQELTRFADFVDEAADMTLQQHPTAAVTSSSTDGSADNVGVPSYLSELMLYDDDDVLSTL
ncbi:MAG: hypothetical protein MHM6MM_001514 [Cercozoa sp. M6MM]